MSFTLDTLLDDLPRRRLDLIALQHAHLARDEAQRAALIGQFPGVEISGRFERDVDDVSAANVGLTFDLPFFDRNQAAVAEQHARRIKA